MKVRLIILLLLCFQSLYSQDKMVTVNGRKVAVSLKGFETKKKAGPTIILENGMGVGIGSWNTVFDEISKVAPVLAYNRLGVETSDKVFEMPTIKMVAENLKALLSTLNIPPPYVL